MNLRRNLLWLVVFISLLFISIKFFPYHCNSAYCLAEKTTVETVYLKKIPISVQISDTEAKRSRGLSGQDGLKDNTGMLFVFDKPERVGFWMKDMKFPIDIVWIRGNTVVFIKKSVSPSTFPEVFYPDTEADRVLELPSGFCDTHNVWVDDSFSTVL